MRVIIPAAGSGARFKTAGYSLPKPLILVGGKPMIQHALEMVARVDPSPLVIIRSEDQYQWGMQVHRMLPHQAICVEYQQHGPALTVLCANGQVADDEPVMVVDCDNWIEPSFFSQFQELASCAVENGHCVTLTTLTAAGDTSTAWSFVHGFGGHVGYVREKERISNRVTCGVNVFPSWRVLREAVCRMVAADASCKGEFFLVPAFNYVQRRVLYFDVPYEAFHTVGTPKALKTYEQDYCSIDSKGVNSQADPATAPASD